MRIAFVITIVLISSVGINAQLIDTIHLKKEVMNLSNHMKRHEFLKNIYEIDQKYRGQATNENIDFQNLISISYYVNKYGYPKKKDFSKYAKVPSLVWIHNRYTEIDRISFPIVLKGFLNGEIPESEIRNYFLRGMYHLRYDDEGFKTHSLNELFEICQVKTDETISIKNLIATKIIVEEKNNLTDAKVSNWKSDDGHRFYYVDSQKIERFISGQKIRIIEKENGKIYILNDYADHSGDLIELEKMANNKYKIKNKETDKYYEFSEDSILYKEGNEILEEYKKY